MRKINLNREAVIAEIAGIIYERNCALERAGEAADNDWVREVNNGSGWTAEVRLPGETYLDERSYTRIEGARLGNNELRRALQLAADYAAGNGWMMHYHELVLAGWTLRRISAALGVDERVVNNHWQGLHIPSAAHQAALAKLQ